MGTKAFVIPVVSASMTRLLGPAFSEKNFLQCELMGKRYTDVKGYWEYTNFKRHPRDPFGEHFAIDYVRQEATSQIIYLEYRSIYHAISIPMIAGLIELMKSIMFGLEIASYPRLLSTQLRHPSSPLHL